MIHINVMPYVMICQNLCQWKKRKEQFFPEASITRYQLVSLEEPIWKKHQEPPHYHIWPHPSWKHWNVQFIESFKPSHEIRRFRHQCLYQFSPRQWKSITILVCGDVSFQFVQVNLLNWPMVKGVEHDFCMASIFQNQKVKP